MGEVCTVNSWGEAAQMIYAGKRPIGIMMICADIKVKNKFVYSAIEGVLRDFVCLASGVLGSCSFQRLREAFRESDVVCVSLTPEDASSNATRCDIARSLRSAGAQEVYGVYLRKANTALPRTREAVQALEQVPPTAELLDKLIIV